MTASSGPGVLEGSQRAAHPPACSTFPARLVRMLASDTACPRSFTSSRRRLLLRACPAGPTEAASSATGCRCSPTTGPPRSVPTPRRNSSRLPEARTRSGSRTTRRPGAAGQWQSKEHRRRSPSPPGPNLTPAQARSSTKRSSGSTSPQPRPQPRLPPTLNSQRRPQPRPLPQLQQQSGACRCRQAPRCGVLCRSQPCGSSCSHSSSHSSRHSSSSHSRLRKRRESTTTCWGCWGCSLPACPLPQPAQCRARQQHCPTCLLLPSPPAPWVPGVHIWLAVSHCQQMPGTARTTRMLSCRRCFRPAWQMPKRQPPGRSSLAAAGSSLRAPQGSGALSWRWRACATRRAITTASSTSSSSACGAAQTSGSRWACGHCLMLVCNQRVPIQRACFPLTKLHVFPTLPNLQVASWNAAYCSADAVVGSLHALFQQLQQQEEQRRSAGGSAGGAMRPVDPTDLRETLGRLPGQQYRVGECQSREAQRAACT